MLFPVKYAKWLTVCFACVVILVSSMPVSASSIIPPKDYGELVRMSEIVVVARASTSNGFWLGGLIMTNTRFEVLEVIKGSLQVGEPFDVSVHGGILGDRGFAIGGSPDYKDGEVYLLSLSRNNNMWMSRHMAYGQMVQKRTVTGDRIFTHLEESHELNVVLPNGASAEPITSYNSERLVNHLKQIAGGSDVWSSDSAGILEYDSHDGSIETNTITGIDAAPPGCAYFEDGGFKLRWKRFDDSLPVTMKVQTGAPANVVTSVQNAVSTWKGIPGVDMATLVYGGNNPVAVCNPPTEIDTSVIPNWEAHIFLDDPCGQITDLTACSGTLAIAGPAYSFTQHAKNGENWYTNVIGFMAVNNGTPGCLNQTQYDQVIIHEMGHILGFGHHTGATANMNANCCSPITSLDESCAVFAYGNGIQNPIPTITSLTPNNAEQGTANLPVTIAGTNFMASSTVGITGGGITINSANFINATQINLNISLSPVAALGARNVTVTNIAPGGGVSNAAMFTVLAPPNPVPTLTAINPTSGEQGSAVPVTLTGTGFATGATVQVSGTGVAASSVVVVNATTITATLSINGAATLGSRNVTVTNPAPGGGVSGTVSFTVLQLSNPVPTLTSINPTSGEQGSAVPVTLSGTGFATGATIQVSGTGVTASSVVVVNSTTITATLTIGGGATLGSRNVTVTNPAPGGGVSGSETFTVTQVPNPVPVLTSINPSSGNQGTVVNATLTGTGFISGSTIQISGSGVAASSVVVVNSTTITATLTIDGAASLGSRDITVTNPVPGGGVSGIQTFTVTLVPNPVPVLTSINPSSGNQGTVVNATLTGTGFVSGSTVQVSGSGVAASSVVVVNATTITATLTVDGGAALGARNVTVTNPAPGGGVSGSQTFTVTQVVNPVPVLSSITPATGTQGNIVNVTLTGSGFMNGSTVQVSGTGITVSNIVVSKVTVINSTSIQAIFTITGGASPGVRNVTVSNPAPGGGVSGSQSFTVAELFVNKAPTLDPIQNISFLHTAVAQQVQLTGISAGSGENQTITVEAKALNPQLLPLLNVSYTSPQATGILTLQNNRTLIGTTSVRVLVRDNAGIANGGVDSLVRVFTINVMLDTDLESDADEVPKAYALHANYPNPFNPSTIIPFTLPERTHVRLSVFDITGRERAVLVNKEYGAGSHQISLDASELSSGVYLVRLQSALGIQSITIMLLK